MEHATQRLTVPRLADGDYLASLPAQLRGNWCKLSFHNGIDGGGAIIQVDAVLAGQTDGISLTTLVPAPGRDHATALTFFPPEASGIRLRLFADGPPPKTIVLTCVRLKRSVAALAIAARNAPHLARIAWRGLLTDPRLVLGRLRAEFSHLAMQERAAPYALWVRLFDNGSAADLQALLQAPDRARWPEISTMIMADEPGAAALAASRQSVTSPIVVAPGQATVAEALASVSSDYVALLQAGEIVPAHALPLLAQAAARLDRPAILFADEDRIGLDGVRSEPMFKPPPSHTLMLSGILATGVWLIRRDHLAAFTPGCEAWAETLRLDAWLRLQESGNAASSHRIPFILTHRRPDTGVAPATALADVVASHIARTGLPARVIADRPLQVRFAAPRAMQRRVSIIVPSACRDSHVLRYLSATLAKTDYTDFELVIVVAGKLPLDNDQERLLDRLEADRRVRRVVFATDKFNYAAANNRAVAETDSPFVCLLNDDVAPLDAGWLSAMVGHMADPSVGVVGARLYYPDHTVQHAGIFLRPAGTGEHMHRFLPADAPGYMGRAQLSQEVSAVTGACLLTRRELWDRLGGLDEAYASAFNDVDFCLRVREAGFAVVLAAEAELTHAESASFGKHYAPDEAERSYAERDRIRSRFPWAFNADPFHNPNLSVRLTDYGSPGFPPRRKLKNLWP